MLMAGEKNFRESWWHNRDYGVFVANPFGREAMKQGQKSSVEIAKGQALQLRFGALIHDGLHAANGTYAIRMGDWKLIERKPPRRNELYNLKEDVAESRDVVASNADLAAQMQKLLSEARDRAYTRPNAGK